MSDLGWHSPMIKSRNTLSPALMSNRMNLEEWLVTYEPSAPAFLILVRRFPQDCHWRWYLNRLLIWSSNLALHDPPEGASPPAQRSLLSRKPSCVEDIFGRLSRLSIPGALHGLHPTELGIFSFGRLGTHKPQFTDEYQYGEWTFIFTSVLRQCRRQPKPPS